MLFLLGCLLKPAPLPEPIVDITPYRNTVDWTNAGVEASQILSQYLQVDTVNPYGNESRGAQFLGSILTYFLDRFRGHCGITLNQTFAYNFASSFSFD